MRKNLNTFLYHMVAVLIFHENEPIVHYLLHKLLLFELAVDDKLDRFLNYPATVGMQRQLINLSPDAV